MAVFAPGDTPDPTQPPPGVDPGMWARIMGFAGNLNPIGSAQAAPAPNPLTNPSPVDPRLAGGGPPVPPLLDQRQRALRDAQAQLGAGPPINFNRQPTLGPNNPIASAASIPTTLPPVAAASPSRPGGIGSDANFPVMGAGGFPTTYAPPGQQPAGPDGPILPAAHPAVAAAPTHAHPVASIDPRMRAQAAAAPAVNPGWGPIDRPNANPGTGGGMLGGALAGPRGGGGAPQMGAFNFASLFGGGQPVAAAAAPSTLPRKKINVGKIPASARAEVPPVSKAPSDYGPLQKGWNFGWGNGNGALPT